MSLVRYVFVCMVYCACSVVASTITVVDAVVRCCTVLYEGHIRLFIQLYYQTELKGTLISAKKQKLDNWEGRRHAPTKLLQILRRKVS